MSYDIGESGREGRLVRVQRVQGMKPGQCKGSQAQEYTFDHTAAILTATTQRLERVLCRANCATARRRSALGARGVIALARQEMGAKSGPARAQEVRANAKATPPSGGGVGAIDERPPAKV